MDEKAAVLLAEDEVNDVFLMQRSVRKMGSPISLQAVKDGEQVIAYLCGTGQYSDRAQHPLPKLIVLDIKMPRKTGLEVLQWLQEDGRFTNIPVVMLTSSKVKTDIDLAHRLGAVAYLVKPVSFEELKELFTDTERFLSEHSVSSNPIANRDLALLPSSARKQA